MWYLIRSYIKFLLKSTNQHGVHSPFVFNLVTQVFYGKSEQKIRDQFLAYKKQLEIDETTIHVTDFGAGSRVFASNQRKVKQIAKNAGISVKRALLLHRLIQHLKIKNSIELGTSLGLSTAAMALNNNNQITTIEGCPETAKRANQAFKTHHLNNITLINDDFLKALSTIKNQTFDLIYIDGNHQKEATIQYFELLLSHIHNNSLIIFDDIYWSKGMTEAWAYICDHPKVTVSIDTFYWGFVFFRKEQRKEHFTIRI
ncbi:O-methyltransferase [Zhouia sp. PK063]|uniref:O-methyltransferase n=1 Tax=Zhouia sp. PK063 TaxID=3373602 RepID=UPI003797148B